jgi:hypothetical protein
MMARPMMMSRYSCARRRTDRKSLLALRGVGPESEAESVRFHGRRVTKVGSGVKHGLLPFWAAKMAARSIGHIAISR